MPGMRTRRPRSASAVAKVPPSRRRRDPGPERLRRSCGYPRARRPTILTEVLRCGQDPRSQRERRGDPDSSGKGRPTPTRAEREAANRRPLVRQHEGGPQTRAPTSRPPGSRPRRAGQWRGEVPPAARQGPQRRWARDYTDSGWHLGELLMPALIVILVATMFLPYDVPVLRHCRPVGVRALHDRRHVHPVAHV